MGVSNHPRSFCPEFGTGQEKVENFQTLFQKHQDFTIDFTEKKPDLRCKHAKLLDEWAQKLISQLSKDSSIEEVYKAKLKLQDKWFEVRKHATRTHQDSLISDKHICIYRVYIDTLETIGELQIKVDSLILAPAKKPRSAKRISAQTNQPSLTGLDDILFEAESVEEEGSADQAAGDRFTATG